MCRGEKEEEKKRKRELLKLLILIKKTEMQTIREKKNNNIAMPLLHENNIDFDLENSDEDDDEDERCQGLLIRRTTSYSNQTDKFAKLSARQRSDAIGVNQAIACALKSTPKAFHYTQKHIQYLPPSIGHLVVCQTIRELDLQGNHLKTLPNEIGNLKSIEICNLGKMILLFPR